jgi:hypothetical protein
MKATGSKAAILTNIFGGASNNEGLGLFTFSFDWQYVRIDFRYRKTEGTNRSRLPPSKPLCLSRYKLIKPRGSLPVLLL